LACGRPVVLADTVGSAPDLAADQAAGRVFPFGDIAALASVLRSITTHPPPLRIIAAKSDAYSVTAAADGIEAAIVRTVSERNSREHSSLVRRVKRGG
jgi:CelD/BcsL family acetyltransferase involved in cellulose biosynthesis